MSSTTLRTIREKWDNGAGIGRKEYIVTKNVGTESSLLFWPVVDAGVYCYCEISFKAMSIAIQRESKRFSGTLKCKKDLQQPMKVLVQDAFSNGGLFTCFAAWAVQKNPDLDKQQLLERRSYSIDYKTLSPPGKRHCLRNKYKGID